GARRPHDLIRRDAEPDRRVPAGDAPRHRLPRRLTSSERTRLMHRGATTMDLKPAARVRCDAVRPAVIDLSHRIDAHPELGFEEEQCLDLDLRDINGRWVHG